MISGSLSPEMTYMERMTANSFIGKKRRRGLKYGSTYLAYGLRNDG